MYEIKYNKELSNSFNEETRKNNREEHIINNIPLALRVANKFYVKDNGFFDIEDIIQLSVLGIIHSIDNFNFNYGVKFSTYAVFTCQGKILAFKRDNNKIRIPRSLLELSNKLNRLTSQGYNDDEIKNILGIDYEQALLTNNALNIYNLDMPISSAKNSEKTSLYDIISDNKNLEEESCTNIDLKNALSKLTDREKDIINLLYFEDKTQMEIAHIIGISQAQVSRIIKKSLRKLRELMEEN